MISSGMDLDESQLVEGLIYEGHNHHLFGPPASGKSWVSLYIAKRVMEQGGVVHYIDWENDKKVFAGRVQSMGIPLDLVENNLSYRFNPTLKDFRHLIGALDPRPDLIIFDSLSAVLNKVLVGENAENSNQQVLTWLTNHFDLLSAQRIASLSIDHTGHDGGRPRGASVKSFYMDVRISQTSEGFNRREAGIVNLHVEKDRHGYFDNDVSVLLGGTPFTSEIKLKGK
jgi:archaellum biogenesis ATPase FlaH